MAAVTLTANDLTPFADIEATKADAMIADALAMAAVVAPCITAAEFEYDAAAKAILRGAILRWNDSGSGALTSEQIGPFGQVYDNRQPRKGLFWPSEINQLQDLCKEAGSGAAFTIDTVNASTVHADTCALVFGANYCDCGADIAGFPLFGT